MTICIIIYLCEKLKLPDIVVTIIVVVVVVVIVIIVVVVIIVTVVKVVIEVIVIGVLRIWRHAIPVDHHHPCS